MRLDFTLFTQLPMIWQYLVWFVIACIVGLAYTLIKNEVFFKLKLPRLFNLLLLNVILLGIILAIAPQQVPVTLYKLSLVTAAGLVGYWLDRALFPYARPDSFSNSPSGELAIEFCFAMLRRAIIVGCAMLAMGMGA